MAKWTIHYQSYDRMGAGGPVVETFEAATWRDALLHILEDHGYGIDEMEDTPEAALLEAFEEANGDGCDLVFNIWEGTDIGKPPKWAGNYET